MLAYFSSHILLLPPLNFELISDYICCVIRNPNAEPLYQMEAGPVYLTNHSVPEVCLPIYPYEHLKVNLSDPAAKIDVTKQEVKYEQLMIIYFLSFVIVFFPEIVLFNGM